jgi:spermidine/putrescine transport system substrate-binding protein
MIRENLVQAVDVANTKNLDARFSTPAYSIAHKDGKRIAVPYMWGTVGICYDSDKVKLDEPSWKALWDEKYKDRIWMFDQMLQSLNVGLKVSGHSVNARDDKALEDAKQVLLKQKPLVKYGNDQFKSEMLQGNILLGMAWNGDAVKIAQEKPSLKYAIPKEGSVIWVDNLVLLANAPNPEGAKKFLDFVLQPDMAAKTSEFTFFASCVGDAKKHLPKEIAENKTVYPDEASLKNCEFREDPGKDIEKFRKIWDEVKGN